MWARVLSPNFYCSPSEDPDGATDWLVYSWEAVVQDFMPVSCKPFWTAGNRQKHYCAEVTPRNHTSSHANAKKSQYECAFCVIMHDHDVMKGNLIWISGISTIKQTELQQCSTPVKLKENQTQRDISQMVTCQNDENCCNRQAITTTVLVVLLFSGGQRLIRETADSRWDWLMPARLLSWSHYVFSVEWTSGTVN